MTKLLTLVFVFLMSANILSGSAFAQASFSAKTDFSAGAAPFSVSSGDFNGDGKPDMVTASSSANTVSVFLNTTTTGASTPTFSAKTDFTVGTGPYMVCVRDLNGDGKPDIVTANYLVSTVSVLFNTTPTGNATPTFTAKTDFTSGDNPQSVTIGDLNGDGKPDIVAANYFGASVSVFLNTTPTGNATPTFSAKTDFTVASGPISVSICDLNGDGKPDIATASQGIDRFSVIFNTTPTGNAVPTFSANTDFIAGSTPGGISTGDINGDGKPDVAVICGGANAVSVYINTTPTGNAVPTFSAKTDFVTAGSASSVIIGDINCDGKPDLILTNASSASISVLINTTTPGAAVPVFNAKTDFTTGVQPYCVSIADLNGDGKPDLTVANYTSNSMSVLLNIMNPGVTPASFSASTDFTAGTAPRYISTGDLNGDGKPDLVVANSTSNSVSVFLNTTTPGASTPSFSPKTDFTTGTTPQSVVIGDLNGDGKPDLATANNGALSVSVFLNTTTPGSSTPTFSTKTDFTTGSLPRGVSIGDFNGDGKPDLAVANNTASSVSVFLNTTTPGASTPTFTAKTDFTAGTNPVSASIGDFNGDGKLDMAVVNNGSTSVSVFLNTTTPGASTPAFSTKTDFTTATQPNMGSVGDFNGDGKPDLVVANSFTGVVSVLLNTTTPGASTPSFSAKTDFTTAGLSNLVSIGDLNCDGKQDMVSANSGAGINNVSVLLNTTTPGATTPTFAAKTDFSSGTRPNGVSFGDFNGDGKPDMAVANNNSGNVSVFMNTAVLPLPVELASFTSSVNSNNVTLNWNTVQEQNNKGFEIERNSFGGGWKKVGYVNGHGTTGTTQNYTFKENNLTTGRYSYRLKQIDYNGNFEYYELSNEVVIGVPTKYSLAQNYPNPFNPETRINYQLPITNYVSLKIYDIAGKEMMQLVNEKQEAGYYTVRLNASSFSSGTYFYQLKADGFSDVKKMVVVK